MIPFAPSQFFTSSPTAWILVACFSCPKTEDRKKALFEQEKTFCANIVAMNGSTLWANDLLAKDSDKVIDAFTKPIPDKYRKAAVQQFLSNSSTAYSIDQLPKLKDCSK